MISVDVKAFAAAFAAVAPVLSAAVKIPAYQHIRVDVAAGRMTLSASDLDMEARAALPAEGDDVAFLMPRAVADFLSARATMAPDRATIEVADGAREIVALHGRARVSQPGLPADDFIAFKDEAAGFRFSLNAGELAMLLKGALRAVADVSAARPAFEGAFLHPFEDSELRAVGTDGNRMHVASVTLPEIDGDWPATGALPGVIVPKRAAERIAGLVDGLENEAAIAGSAHFLSVAVGDIMLLTRLIGAAFYDYTRIIPAKGDVSATVDGAAMARALKALAIVPAKTSGKAGATQWRAARFAFGDGSIALAMKGDGGMAEDVVAAQTKGEVTVAFGARFIEDAIAAIGADKVRLTMGGNAATAASASWIVDAEASDVFAIVAPRRW